MNLTAIHQIEITSRCNLRCQYCVHPHMPREKTDMDRATFVRALAIAKRLHIAHKRPHAELNLCGIGESTLHPDFAEFVLLARDYMGDDIHLILATNGVGVTEDHARAMADARMDVWVSLHRPEKAGPTVEMLKRYGVLRGVSADPSISAVDWAGQVKYHVSAPRTPCPWLTYGWAFVMVDGRIGTCCFDGQGTDGVLGSIWDEPETIHVRPYSLCVSCHHDKPEA